MLLGLCQSEHEEDNLAIGHDFFNVVTWGKKFGL